MLTDESRHHQKNARKSRGWVTLLRAGEDSLEQTIALIRKASNTLVTPREYEVGMEINGENKDGNTETWIVESMVGMEEDGREKVMLVLTPLDKQEAVSAEFDADEIDAMERATKRTAQTPSHSSMVTTPDADPTSGFRTRWDG